MENVYDNLTLKLLIDKQANKVLFGEANIHAVELMFRFLSTSAFEKLLKKGAMVGSVVELYHSLCKLNETYIISKEKVSSLVNPAVASTSQPKTNTKDNALPIRCPCCGTALSTGEKFVDPMSDANTTIVEVNGVVTYTLMDDLTVGPMSTISSIALLKKFQIKDLESLEEKTVRFGDEEALKIFEASLETKTVLTDVYLKGNRAANA
ncbi:hypothetical protein FCM35_KLT18052 [Carex littledalei]|uniref:Uncharacterized protein n=1 Tax=Carex littledalei TaxID=544730 RepID=A0A833R2T4_9POAL|nr:hypothetical protein FCM35_KLT18052 [Carex littledalei]